MSDETIKAAVQEILEVLRKHELAGFFTIQGRELCETRWWFPFWSAFRQEEAKGGSVVRFNTRRDGERLPEKDIQDSVTIAYSFASEIFKACGPAIATWEELKDKLGASGWTQFRGGTPPWDLK